MKKFLIASAILLSMTFNLAGREFCATCAQQRAMNSLSLVLNF